MQQQQQQQQQYQQFNGNEKTTLSELEMLKYRQQQERQYDKDTASYKPKGITYRSSYD
jgi:hypothetical protein